MDKDRIGAEGVESPDGGTDPTRTDTYHFTHDIDGPRTLSMTIVRALADISGGDVTDLGFSLYDYVDTDALDRLFESRRNAPYPIDGHLTFTAANYRITVRGNGDIVIRVLDEG